MSISNGLVYVGTTLVAGGITAPTQVSLEPAISGTTAGVAYADGAWVELTSSAPSGVHFLRLHLTSQLGNNATNSATLIEIGTGALGVETQIASFNAGNMMGSIQSPCQVAEIPFPITAGTRVSLRLRSARTALAWTASAAYYSMNHTPIAPTPMGVNNATAGGVVLGAPAANNGTTYGAWTEISSSTAARFRALHLGPALAGTTNIGATIYKVDMGVGALGAEVSLGMPLMFNATTAEVLVNPAARLFNCDIPAGSRLAARYTRTNTGPCDLIVHGVQ